MTLRTDSEHDRVCLVQHRLHVRAVQRCLRELCVRARQVLARRLHHEASERPKRTASILGLDGAQCQFQISFVTAASDHTDCQSHRCHHLEVDLLHHPGTQDNLSGARRVTTVVAVIHVQPAKLSTQRGPADRLTSS